MFAAEAVPSKVDCHIACRTPPAPFDRNPVFKKLKDAEVAAYTEAQELNSGAVLEAVVQKGEGTATPQNGDLVYFHFSVREAEDEENVIYSTRMESDVSDGCPMGAILGKYPRLPKAWEMSLAEMTKGERRVLRVKPSFGFDHKDCNYHLPLDDLSVEHKETVVDIQLINNYSVDAVMVSIGSGPPVMKRILSDGEGYENPRPPYKVEARLTMRRVSTDGIQCKGEVLYSTREDTVTITMGDPNVPPGIQSCLNGMVKNEHAVCLLDAADVSSDALTQFPKVAKHVRQMEIEIQTFNVIQVRDIYGDGSIVKYRLTDGEGTFPSDCPLQDCRVWIHYKVRKRSGDENPESEWLYDSRDRSDRQPIAIDLGCGHLPYGLESCIHLMLPKELSTVDCKASNAYANVHTLCPPPEGLSPDDDVQFEVELIRFEKGMQWSGMNIKEALIEADKMKKLANDLYKEGALKLAGNKYQKIVQQLSQLREFESEEEVNEADRLTISCFGNLASCAMQEGEYVEAIDWCNKALKYAPSA